ncbi:MAG: hypothetical protein DRP71_03890 [Verrucomicrobia bacterium]|nr:MAG: hypothetical protein DRP71_03890 [Verrucomicrobiota bacterium]
MGADGLQLSGGLLDGHIGFEPTHDLVCASVVAAAFGRERDRGENFVARVELEGVGHHAYDRERSLIEQDALSEDGRIGLESALPEFVAEDHDIRLVRCILAGQETPAQGWLYPEDAEEIR